jgi:hypothetical protein
MSLQPDGYTFELTRDVTRTPVHYLNRYGIEIAADLCCRTDLDEATSHPALVIGPPHGSARPGAPAPCP